MKTKEKTIKEEVWTGYFVKDGIAYFLKKGDELFMPIERLNYDKREN